jgi:hypothetical protein
MTFAATAVCTSVRRLPLRTLWIAAAVCALVASPVRADVIALEDANSSLRIDPTTDAGVFGWQVGGVEQLSRQWYFVRVGDAQVPLNALVLTGSSVIDSNGNGLGDSAWLRYTGMGVSIELRYLLTGGEDAWGSALGEAIKITNVSGTTVSLSLFQYNDFDLGNSSASQHVEIMGGATAVQTGGLYALESAATPAPAAYEAGDAELLWAKLSAGESPNGNALHTGNAAWAFQWDFTLNKNQNALISQNKLLVPEPATACLLLAGAGAMALRRRRV